MIIIEIKSDDYFIVKQCSLTTHSIIFISIALLHQRDSTGARIFGQCQSACRQSASSLHARADDDRTLAVIRAQIAKDSRITHAHTYTHTYARISRGRGYCWGASARTGVTTNGSRKWPRIDSGPGRSWTSKKRQLAETLPRHGTAPDTKHGQTAWRPPVSFLPTPASRRPRTIHRPIRYHAAPL